MTTAEKVRALIHESRLSQKAYAQSVGIHHITLCNCLKDDNLSMKSLRKIADKEGIPIDSLLPDSTPKEEKAPAPLINGYIEYDGKIEAIRSVEDLEHIWKQVSQNYNVVGESVSKESRNKPTIGSPKNPFVEMVPRVANEGVPTGVVEDNEIANDDTLNSLKYCILFDLDNTLINSDAKRPYLAQKPLDWKAIHAQIPYYRLYDGIEEVLQWTKRKGIKVGIVSSARRDHIEKVLEHFNLGDYVDIIIGNHWTYKKPNPKLIEMALGGLNVNADKALYIGDHEVDAEMCARASIRFVGCLWDCYHKRELTALGCKTISKPQEIMGLLNNLDTIPLLEPKKKTTSMPKSKKQTTREKPKYDIRCSDEGYAYFYMNVPLSNWWDSVPAIEYDGHTFNASESIFMYLKAQCFNDEEIAEKIVEADNMTYDRPKKRWDAVKKLGKKVRGFDDKIWARHNRDAMYTALKQKALYDEEFKRVLLDPKYAGLTFVEASKHDQIWGIGINAKTAMEVGRAGWQGHNFLGRALTDLRNELRPDLQ